jgi:hypothetical protein
VRLRRRCRTGLHDWRIAQQTLVYVSYRIKEATSSLVARAFGGETGELRVKLLTF